MRDEFGNEQASAAVNVSRQSNYTTSADGPLEAGKILAIAGGAAGALAGLWVVVTEREKKQEPKSTLEQARTIVEEAIEKARKDGLKPQGGLPLNVSQLAAMAPKKAGKKSRKSARKPTRRLGKGSQAERNETIEKIAQMLREARQEAVKTYGQGAGEVSGLLHQVRGGAEQKLGDARKLSAVYSEQARRDAERARGELAHVAETVRAKALNAEHQAGDIVATAVLPRLKDVVQEAQVAVETGKLKTGEIRQRAESELLPEAKKRAEELRRRAQAEVLPEAKKRAEELVKKAETDLLPEAKKKAETLTHTVEEQAKVAKKSLEIGSAEAAARVAAVEAQAAHAGEAVKEGTRDLGSLLLWLTLAGTLIFNVFLNEEQQKRLKEIAAGIFGEAKDMYQDMKGEGGSQSR